MIAIWLKESPFRMNDFKSQPRIIADIVMLSTAKGGRSCGIAIGRESRYMPHLVIGDRTNRIKEAYGSAVPTRRYMGVFFEPAEELADSVTGSGRYPLRLMYHPRVNYNSLQVGARFAVLEGGNVVGHGVVIQCDPALDSDTASVEE